MQFLDPRNDIAFKKIFGSEEHNMLQEGFSIEIISRIIDLTIEHIKKLQHN